MPAARTDRLFARFQRTRDPRLLAAVFDRTAPEILRVAQHLAGDPHQAEDLVQATFLKAIEHADRYDRRQPVLPWLLGILANAARHERRQRMRTPDVRAARSPEQDPASTAAQTEFDGALREALERLAEPYRQVLLLHLEHGWSGARIAELTGRKPATVRTQIARGLDLLRKTLPAGFAAGTALVAGSGRGLAAVRAAVFEQAGLGAVPIAGFTTLFGVLLMNKLAVASVGLVLCALAVFPWPAPAPEEAAPRAPVMSDARQPRDAVATTSSATREPRPEAAHASGTDSATEPLGTAPVDIVVRVVDVRGRPVADARVEVWAMPGSAPLQAERTKGSAMTRDGTQPLLVATTQNSGACTVLLDREPLLLRALHPQAGASGDVGWLRPRTRVILMVERQVPVSVLVLRGDEQPAADVEVDVSLAHGNVGDVPEGCPTRTDRDGRCVLPLNQGHTFNIRAWDATTRSFHERVRTTASTAPLEVVVRFPGALSVQGTLRDADGVAVAGEVALWEQQTQEQREADPTAAFHRKVTTGREGGFRIDVPRASRFDLIGSAKGHPNGAVTSVDVSAATPHARADVRLLRAAAITGSVAHPDGTPWANVHVSARAEGWEWSGLYTEIGPRDLFGEGEIAARTDAEGVFRLDALHPRAKYTVTCMPDTKRPVARVAQRHVIPDGPPLQFVVSDTDLQTGRIMGTVLSAATGKPVTRFKQWLLVYQDGKGQALSNELNVADEQGAFSSKELSQGGQFAVAFAADGLAPALAGPITISQAEHRFEVRLLETGAVTVRVVEADGSPAVHAEVRLQLLDGIPRNQGWTPQRTDENGRVAWSKIALGRHQVSAGRGAETVPVTVECDVRSGVTADVVLRLPP